VTSNREGTEFPGQGPPGGGGHCERPSTDAGHRGGLGVLARSRKENERPRAIRPLHLERIKAGLRRSVYLEHGYGEAFGMPDGELAGHVGGLRGREQLVPDCDVIVCVEMTCVTELLNVRASFAPPLDVLRASNRPSARSWPGPGRGRPVPSAQRASVNTSRAAHVSLTRSARQRRVSAA
jgi:hypothetical protein